MASKTRRESRMAGRTSETAKDRDKGFGSDYLNIPEDLEYVDLEKRKNLNIVPYVVATNNHPDKKDGYPAKGDLWWRKPIKVHKQIGVDNGSYLCPKTIGKSCPICEEVELLSQEYSKNEKVIGNIRAKKRDLIAVVDPDNEKKGIQLFDVSYHTFTKLLLKEVDEGKEEWARFAEPEDGFTIVCRFSEEKYNNKPWWKIDRIDFDKRDNYSSRLLKQVPDLDSMLVVLEYDELKNIFMQMDEESSEKVEKEERSDRREPEEDNSDRREPEEEDPNWKPEDTPNSWMGVTVKYQDETDTCVVVHEDGDHIRIEDQAGDTFDVEKDECEIVEEEEGAKEEEEVKEEKTERSSRSSRKETSKNKTDCPSGYEWGAECGQKTECSKECPEEVWEKCNTEFERLAAK